MNKDEFELSFTVNEEQKQKILDLLKDNSLKHYLLKLSDNTKLDVVEYEDYKKLQQIIEKAIEYIENDVAYNELGLKNKDCFENDLLRILRGDSND